MKLLERIFRLKCMTSDIYNEKVPKIKSKKTGKNISTHAHTPKGQKGMGDYYGTGITAKIGRQREGVGFEGLGKKKLRVAPRSVA